MNQTLIMARKRLSLVVSANRLSLNCLNLWVFDVVTISIKCKNCFERGGFGSLSCFGIKGFKYLSCFGIKCKRFKYFPPSKTTWTGEQIQICKIWSFAEIWSLESRKKEVIKHTNVDIEQKEVHDYWPWVYSEVDDNTRRGLPFLC